MKYKNIFYLSSICLLFLTLCLTGCNEKIETKIVDTQPSNEEIKSTLEDSEEILVQPEPIIVEDYNSDVKNFLMKRKNIESIRYSERISKSNGVDVSYYFNFDLKGKNMKKRYTSVEKLGTNFFYDTVYLNLENKTAIGICAKVGGSCDIFKGVAKKLDFNKEYTGYLPNDFIDNLPFDAKLAGQETVENRKSTILEYTNGTNIVRLSVDNYYVLPLKYIEQDSDENILEKREYSIIEVGEVKDSELFLPLEYNITS